jgi:O-antigen ligase
MYKERFLVAYLGFFAFLMAISAFMNKSVTLSFDQFMLNFSTAVIVCYGIRYCPKKLTGFLSVIASVWICLNAITWKPGGAFLTSNGQEGFFFGTKTTITYYQIFTLFFLDLYMEILKKKSLFIRLLKLLVIVSLVYYYIVQPISTSAICLAIYLLSFVLIKYFKNISKFVLNKGFWITCGANFLLVFSDFEKYFANFIVNVLKEDITLNHRSLIWEVVLNKIKQSLFFGHGFDSSITFTLSEFTSYNQSAHNQFLSWLFLGGIFGFLFIMFLIHIVRSRNKFNPNNGYANIVLITFLQLSFLWISEQYNSYMFFTAFMIASYYTSKIIKRHNVLL